jgi:secreted trypsin-like serine protease
MLAVIVIAAVLHLVAGQTSRDVECGKRLESAGLIYGGKATVKGSWPWLVAFTYRSNGEFFCAGSLVSKRHVVTG